METHQYSFPFSFNMEPSYDFLHIYEGEDSNSLSLEVSRVLKPQKELRAAEIVFFWRFEADASVGLSGFAIEFKGTVISLTGKESNLYQNCFHCKHLFIKSCLSL